MQYARLIICLITIRLAIASIELQKYHDGLGRWPQNRRQHEEFGREHPMRLIRRTSKDAPSPPPSQVSVSFSPSPAVPQIHRSALTQRLQSGPGLPEETHGVNPALPQNTLHRADSFRSLLMQSALQDPDPGSRSGSPQSSRQNLSPSSQSSAASDPVIDPSESRAGRGSSRPQLQRQTGSLPTLNPESITKSSQQSFQRASLPIGLPSTNLKQSASSSPKITPFMSAKGSFIGKVKGLFGKPDKGSQPTSGTASKTSSKDISKSPHSSVFSWPSLSASPSKEKSQKLASTSGPSSSSSSIPIFRELLHSEGKVRKALHSLKPGQHQLDILKKAVSKLSTTKHTALPPPPKPSETTDTHSIPRLDHKAIALEDSKAALQRSNSDSMLRPLTPASAKMMRRRRMMNPRERYLRPHNYGLLPGPISPPTLPLLEIARTQGGMTPGSTGSSIGTSAFAQLAQGPPIVGAGLAKTTLHSEPTIGTLLKRGLPHSKVLVDPTKWSNDMSYRRLEVRSILSQETFAANW